VRSVRPRQSLLLLFLLGCTRHEADSRPAIATIGDRAILIADLAQSTSVEERRRFVDREIARVLASQEATKRGLTETDAVARAIAGLRRDAATREEALLRDALFQSIREGLVPTEIDLQHHYAATKLRYGERQVTLRWWSFGSSEEARNAVAKSGSKRGLDLARAETIGPIFLHALPARVVPEVFHFEKPGDRLPAGSESEGFGVVELVEVLPAVPQPFEAVRDRVEESWRTLEAQRAFAKLLAELREKADIEIDEAALADDALWKRQGDKAPAASR